MKIIVTAYDKAGRVIFKRAYTNSSLPSMTELFKLVPEAERISVK